MSSSSSSQCSPRLLMETCSRCSTEPCSKRGCGLKNFEAAAYSFAPPVCLSLAPIGFDSEEWSCRRKMLRTM